MSQCSFEIPLPVHACVCTFPMTFRQDSDNIQIAIGYLIKGGRRISRMIMSTMQLAEGSSVQTVTTLTYTYLVQ